MTPHVLILHPDAGEREALLGAVSALGHTAAASPELDSRDDTHDGAVVILHCETASDMASFMAAAGRRRRQLWAIAALSASNADAAGAMLRQGAIDFIILPASSNRLQASLSNAMRIRDLQTEIHRSHLRSAGAPTDPEIIALSPAMRRATSLAERAARSRLPILLEGEPGAGHETLARSIHAQSDRRGEPLVKLTIASAAVTPLIKPQPSLDELLQTPSVLYIDDVAEASPRTQSLILERLVRGGRIIAATNACLIPLVKARLFNEQLYYRLSVFPITVPALRNRLEDFGELIQRLLPSFAIEQGKRVETIDGAALRMLKKYAWPGNLAQLEAALYRAVALADDWALQIKDFPQIAAHVDGYGVELPPAPNASGKQARSVPAFVNGVVSKEPAGQGIRALTENGDVRPIDAVEADLIRLALAHYRGHMTEAARRLGIGRSTLYRKIREFGLGASFV